MTDGLPRFLKSANNGGRMTKRIIIFPISVLLLFSFLALNADESSLLRLTEAMFAVPSPTGYEEPLVEFIEGKLSQGAVTKRDNLGSLYVKWGKQDSWLALCTPMDEMGYFVSGIDPEGYLRLDKAVFGPSLLDSYHLGHAMIVWTANGPVEGVLALPSLHILSSEMKRELEKRPGLEWAYLDIGVNSEVEAREKGVAMLDAVTPWRDLTRLAGSQMAGYSLGLKMCTALVLEMAEVCAVSENPETAFVWMAQTKFPLRRSRPPSSLGALRVAKELETGSIIVIDVFPCDRESEREISVGGGPVLVYPGEKGSNIAERIQKLSQNKGFPFQLAPDYSSSVMNPFLTSRKEVIGLLLPVKFSETPAEVVDARDADTLRSLLLALLEEGRI
jgi:putative aminopeptidase FrvX